MAESNITAVLASLRQVPDIVETRPGEVLAARTAQVCNFTGLGPPDLCHVVRTDNKTQAPMSTYHLVSGVELASPPAIGCYVSYLKVLYEQGLLGADPSEPVRTGNSRSIQTVAKVGGFIYCCYHPFAKIDVRIDVSFPLSIRVEAFGPNEQRVDVLEADEIFWKQLHVAGVLRALEKAEVYPPGPPGLFRVDPLPDIAAEDRFFDAFRAIFPYGPQLGCDPFIQTATLTFNTMVNTVVKSFGHDCGRWELLIRLFRSLLHVDHSVAALLAQALLECGMDAFAAKHLVEGLRLCPHDTSLLHVLATFLLQKKEHENALYVAKRLVEAGPWEVRAWKMLVSCYVALNKYCEALCALNSCPLTAPLPHDMFQPPKPAGERIEGEVDREKYFSLRTKELAYNEAINPCIREQYGMLAKITNSAGWEHLLVCRARVFLLDSEDADSESSLYHSTDLEEIEPNCAKKRLCEHWLNDLFFMIFRDLRIHTTWSEGELLPRSKSLEQWEVCGDVAYRLERTRDAWKSYHCSVIERYSPRILLRMIDILSVQGDLCDTLRFVAYLFSYPEQKYELLFKVCGNPIFPNPVTTAIMRLVRKHGLESVRAEAVRMSIPPTIFHRLGEIFDYAVQCEIKGTPRVRLC